MQVFGTHRLGSHLVAQFLVQIRGLLRPLRVRHEAPFPACRDEGGVGPQLLLRQEALGLSLDHEGEPIRAGLLRRTHQAASVDRAPSPSSARFRSR